MKIQNGCLNNCFFATLYLTMRNKIDKVLLVSSHAWYIPAHIVCRDKRGNYIHFKYFRPQCPIWFFGTFEGIRLSTAHKLLEKEGRTVIASLHPWMFSLLFLLMIPVLFVPWLIFWVVYPIGRWILDIYRIFC